MLASHVVDTSNGDPAARTVVLLHGFGAPGDDLVALARYLRRPARYVFPAAPRPLPEWGDARAWWLIDLESVNRGDRRGEVPDGLDAARAAVNEVIDGLGVPDDRLVLGGFSQGSMLALDVAVHRERPPAALILWSTTFLAERVWSPRFARLADVPIAMTHGTRDPLLPHAMSELLRDQLVLAGAKVDWHSFDGAHEIPPVALQAAARLI